MTTQQTTTPFSAHPQTLFPCVLSLLTLLFVTAAAAAGPGFIGPPPYEKIEVAVLGGTAADPLALPARQDLDTGKLEIRFPGNRLSQTVLEGLLLIPTGKVKANRYGFYNLRLNGHIARDGQRLDHFSYRFDFPVMGEGVAMLPLPFKRHLRPGTYELEIEVEELSSERVFFTRTVLEVPQMTGALDEEEVDVTSPAAALQHDVDLPAPEEPRLSIVRPDSPILKGLQRFTARTSGPAVARVDFLLDGQRVFSRSSPPYTVELDLGDTARVTTLEVVAKNREGDVVASDRMVLNAGEQPFVLSLVSPRPDRRYETEVPVEIDVDVPKGHLLDRVELFLGEEKVATLDRLPLERTITLPEAGSTAVLRVVGYTKNGLAAEDVAVVNGGGAGEELDVHLVELYTTVTDRKGHPVSDLDPKSFRVLDQGMPQRIVEFKRGTELPSHVGLAVDVSASMSRELPELRQALLAFFDMAMRTEDETMLVTFDHQPRVAVDFTGDRARLANALIGVQARGGTALYDGLYFTLSQFTGIKGQRAVILFSDGQEHESRLQADQVVELARRFGITLYTIGLRVGPKEAPARQLLDRLARETGGRSFFLEDLTVLPAVYQMIEQDLRSRYLLAYQPEGAEADGAFRQVDVEVSAAHPGTLVARTIRGYYP